MRNRGVSVAGQETVVARLNRELDEALEEKTAISEVLRLVSTSSSNLETVLQSVAERAAHICQAQFVDILLVENDNLRDVAWFGELKRTLSVPLDRFTVSGRSVCEMRPFSVDDLQNAGDEFARGRELARKEGHRSILAVPLIRDGRAVGTIMIRRTEIRPFEHRHIALLTAFAAQAVIAIENTRLLNELRQRTSDLTESLEQQTATSKVLEVIIRSAFNLQTVFDTLVESAARLCRADKASMLRLIDGQFKYVAFHGFAPEYAEYMRTLPTKVRGGSVTGRAVLGAKIVHVHDVLADPEFTSVDAQKRGEFRTALGVPLMREGTSIGAFFLSRANVEPFTQQQIDLVTTFADQAVIAIENVRLFEAEQQRTRELSESLGQQTATSEVLSVIASSSGELQPVFQVMLENAVRICEAKFGELFRFDGQAFHFAAEVGTPAELVEFQRQRGPFQPEPGTHLNRVIRTKQVSHTADTAAEAVLIAPAKYGGARSIVAVPMLKDDVLIGAISIFRQEVRPFTDKQIALVQNFADQAVVAIENARLLNELRQRTRELSESLEQQTATSKVLEVISSSPGDLKPVFEAILANAVRLCGAKFGNLYLREGDGFRAAAMHNAPSAYAAQRAGIVHRSPYSTVYQAAHTKQPAQTADITKLPGYLEGDPWLTSAVSLGGYRGVLSVPMLHEDESIGTITIFRQEAEPFANKQIELLTNFAKQAVIAIENARLLNELRQSLDQQTAMAEVLGVISSSPGDLQPVFDNMLRNAVRICDAKFGMLLRFDGEAFHMAAEVDLPPDYAEFEKRRGSFLPPAGTLLDRVMKTKRVNYTADMAADAVPGSPAKLGGARSAVAVPMHESAFGTKRTSRS